MLAPALKPQRETFGSTPLSFAQSINGARRQAMELDPNVFVCGIGADTPTGIFGTTTGLVDQFGAKRVFDTPIAEAGITALAAGAGPASPMKTHLHVVNFETVSAAYSPQVSCRAIVLDVADCAARRTTEVRVTGGGDLVIGGLRARQGNFGNDS